MPNWKALTETHLRTRLSGREIDAFKNGALGPGEADPVAGMIEAVTERIRGSIAANPRNELGAAGQIPVVLFDAALSILTMRMMVRAYGEILDPTGERKRACEAAEALLEKIEEGKGPAIPGLASDDAPGVQSTAPGILVTYYETHEEDLTREQQDGL